jgi:serine protease AprX
MRQPEHRTSTSSTRANALWGRGSRILFAVAVLALAFGAGSALAAKRSGAFVPSMLMSKAQANPDKSFNVIVRGIAGEKSASIANYFTQGKSGKLKKQFYSVNGVAGSISGADLVKLAANNHVFSITSDVRFHSADQYESQEVWRTTDGVTSLLGSPLSPAPQAPAIAVVDSGVDATKLADFGNRVVASVNFCSTCTDGTVDDEGHGTMVASLAAGAGLYSGVAQNAPIVNVRTSDASGASRESDVIASVDWILQNKDQYNIRVANFSMRAGATSSFRYDPLDAAVEKLWFNGVVVVAAVGNYGSNGEAMQVAHAPGNDPFVISVGALGTQGTVDPSDDTAAPWSVYGHTLDGFAKPEISAPGRWVVAAVPMNSTLPTTAPDRVVAPGYMWMSGTSLASPIVAGAAAQVLAHHPNWTPDQVKGALLVTANPTAAGLAGGAGEVDAAAAAGLHSAPNLQRNLDKFITKDASGNPTFDGDAWQTTLQSTTDWSATDWSATDWSATDWSQTDWSATDWSATDWSATDWSATDWSATDWSATDWSATDWSATDWSATDWSATDWSATDWSQ